MPVASIDLDDGLAALLASDLAALNVDVAAPATPNPISFGENVRSALQALIDRAQGHRLLSSSTTIQTLQNTTTPTDVIGYSMPGGTLAAGDIVRVRVGGRYQNDQGGTQTITYALSIGGTTIWGHTTTTLADDNGNRQTWELDMQLYVASTTSVAGHGYYRHHTTNAPTTGLGSIAATLRVDAEIGTNSFVTVPDLASTRTVSLTVTHSIANSAVILDRYGYTIERMRPA